MLEHQQLILGQRLAWQQFHDARLQSRQPHRHIDHPSLPPGFLQDIGKQLAELPHAWAAEFVDRAGGIRWPSCRAFEGEGCKDCAGCAFQGKVKSPLNLSLPKPAAPAAQAALSPLAPHAGVVAGLDNGSKTGPKTAKSAPSRAAPATSGGE